METLTAGENLIVHVARATCFSYRFTSAEVPESDVTLYVVELIRLFRQKPHALVTHASGEPDKVSDSVLFCAEQLTEAAPAHAAKLRDALEQNQ